MCPCNQPTNIWGLVTYMRQITTWSNCYPCHTPLRFIKCIVVFQNVTLIAKWQMGVQTCSLAMIGSLQVEYSSWWLAQVSFTFLTYLPLRWVLQKLPHLAYVWIIKERLILGLRVYIGALTCSKFLQTLFLLLVKDVSYVSNYGYFTLFIHNLTVLLVW